MGKRWTTQERQYLRRVYADKPTHEIAQELGRDSQSIRYQAWYLNLPKSMEYRLDLLKKASQNYHQPRSIK